MAEALRRAEVDSGGTGLLAAAESLRTISELSWPYRNPALAVGRAARDRAAPPRQHPRGRQPRRRDDRPGRRSDPGRRASTSSPSAAVRPTGRAPGCAPRAVEPDWTVQGDDVPEPDRIGLDRPLVSPVESDRGVMLPGARLPVVRDRAAGPAGPRGGRAPAALGRLWSAFSEVAAANPDAWIQRSFTPEELTEPTAGQPDDLVPVHEAAVLEQPGRPGIGPHRLLGRRRRAGRRPPRPLGVPPRRAPRRSTTGTCPTGPTCCSSPALRLAGRDAFALAGIDVDDVAHVDLYSCFPAAVQIGATELGFVPGPRHGRRHAAGAARVGAAWGRPVRSRSPAA